MRPFFNHFSCGGLFFWFLLSYATMPYKPEESKFPLKDRDTAIANATGLLRTKGYMKDDSDDEDDYCFGDDDMPYILIFPTSTRLRY